MTADNLQILEQAMHRRTIAVISHPDAGKSTLTEALLLHAHAIDVAGAVHGKAGRRGTVSDWMAMEQQRGISVSSAVVQFQVGDTVINLVDTPGHADFSEDTFRVLTAVDAVVMLIDAAKGLETQTMKLFDVCRARRIPVMTMINKWDRPGGDALALVDEIRDRTGLRSMPITWPVGQSGVFHGLIHTREAGMRRYRRTAGGARATSIEILCPDDAAAAYGEDWATAIDEVDLLQLDVGPYSRRAYLDQQATPLFFGSAVQNIGVAELLDFIATDAPAAEARESRDGHLRPVNSAFSAYVFKVQSGMNPAHRDRVAFARVCSGVFERGMVVTHARTGRPFATKYAQQVFGRERETIDQAWPGDVIGLVNATSLRPGDTLYTGDPVVYAQLPYFAPEHFRIARLTASDKHKQFRSGLAQLAEEGVIQLLQADRLGAQRPILGAVGPMQFEVAQARMAGDFGAPIHLEPLDYRLACAVDAVAADELAATATSDCLIVTRENGEPLALFRDKWRLGSLQRTRPHLEVRPLPGIADTTPVPQETT